VDLIAPRSTHRTVLSRLLRAAAGPGPRPTPVPVTGDALVTEPERLHRRDAWEVVRGARNLQRPTTLDYVHRIADDFQELRGDRLGGDCGAVVGGPAVIAGRPVVVIGHQKGHTGVELAARNFGMPNPAGYRKAHRLMRLAAKLGLPVVTLVDTPGAYPGIAAEEQGQAMAIAENLRLMATLPVPVVTVVTGEGGSGGALALAVADRVLMFSGAVFSVISPEGCAAILWNDPAQTRAAARELRLTAPDLLELGVVDGVLPEPAGGVQADPGAAANRLREVVVVALDELGEQTAQHLVEGRYRRFRRFGGSADGHGGGTT
jgi:acetyl-CoA carboxylase carboxyl transferase subunit beta